MDARRANDEAREAFDKAVWSRHPDAGVNPRVMSPGGR